MLKFAQIRDDLFVGIMAEFEFSDEINEQTILLLNQLSRDDVLAVHWCAEDLVAGRRSEVEYRDGDMAEVVEKMDAMLEALVPWLKRNGIIYAINERCAS
jgi:hypothetical protein